MKIGIDEEGYGDAPRNWERAEGDRQAMEDYEDMIGLCKQCGGIGRRDEDACLDLTGTCAYCHVGALEGDALTRACEQACANKSSVLELYQERGPSHE